MDKYIKGSKSNGYTELNGYIRQYVLLNVGCGDEYRLPRGRLLS